MVRRFSILSVLIILVWMVALPVLGQEEPIPSETATDQAINAVVTVGFLAVVIQYLIEWAKGRFTTLDSDVVRIVALVLGYGAAWLWGLDVASEFGYEGLPVALSYVVTAFVVAGVSGAFATAKNALRANDPTSSISNEAHQGGTNLG